MPAIQPLPVPVEFSAKLINDVKQANGKVPVQMVVLEFFNFNGVFVTMMDKNTLKEFIKGLQDMRDKMTDNGRGLQIARDMPNA